MVQYWWYTRNQRLYTRPTTHYNEICKSVCCNWYTVWYITGPSDAKRNEEALRGRKTKENSNILLIILVILSFILWDCRGEGQICGNEKWVGLECIMWNSQRIDKTLIFFNDHSSHKNWSSTQTWVSFF